MSVDNPSIGDTPRLTRYVQIAACSRTHNALPVCTTFVFGQIERRLQPLNDLLA
ncbi:hypothetical protein [Kingella negevensis]|uniref:hypothetical protein n=1 Tax=Kingella negevensis TaxID=1522312 RepID=UPI00254C54FC|nr:hypothetical protein [Kingella negevensis]MDK4680045.1 hypothetical protein [Kingella negevensis]